MAKINIQRSEDAHGRDMYVLTKKRGKISNTDIYEAFEHDWNNIGAHFLQIHHISEDVPFGLYDPGDEIILYKPDELFGEEEAQRLMFRKSAGSKCPVCETDLAFTEGYGYCHVCGQALER